MFKLVNKYVQIGSKPTVMLSNIVNCNYLIIHSPQGFSGIIYNTIVEGFARLLRCSLQVMKE